MTRQLTAVAVGLFFAFGTWAMSETWLLGEAAEIKVGIPTAIFALGVWISYRLVNYPRFADFLISVEAELDKVSWASWPELYRSTIVVIGTMFFTGFMLAFFDIFWFWLFKTGFPWVMDLIGF